MQVTENDYIVYKQVLLNEAINNDQSSHYLLKDPRQKQSDNRPSCYCYFFNKLLIDTNNRKLCGIALGNFICVT